jgi:hypothetical protein
MFDRYIWGIPEIALLIAIIVVAILILVAGIMWIVRHVGKSK